MNNDLKVLKDFLEIPINSSDGVFEKFLNLPGAIFRGKDQKRFLYLPGNRKNKVLLVAHADTVWDRHYFDGPQYEQKLIIENNIIRSAGTDIVELCRDITGVNLSVGYHNEHSEEEYLDLDQWQNTLNLCRGWLSENHLPKFSYVPDSQLKRF